VSPAATAVTGRRAVTVRHEVRGTLRALTALRVGGWGSAVDADLVVARDGLGRVVIPGTSLAGALRAWLGSVSAPGGGALFSLAALGKVFGDLELHSQQGEVCRIRVDDAVTDGETVVEIRDGVGIDRGTGTAAAGVLYQHEVVPAGTRFAVRNIAEEAGDDAERVEEALDLLVTGLAEGHVEIGAARTRGLGGARLEDIQRTRVDLTDRSQVLAWLCGQAGATPAAGHAADSASESEPVPDPDPDPGPGSGSESRTLADGRLGIEITWSAVTPVMVQASTVNEPNPEHGRAVDTVPLRTAGTEPGDSARLLLPGSSIKGVVRSHAERIVRTLRNIDELPGRLLDQLNDERLTVVGALFGTAGGYPGSDPARSKEHQPTGPERDGRRGALSVRDCLGTSLAERVVTHVAVDRWTGGAAENLLFCVQEPAAADWEPIRMSLDVRRASRAEDADGAQALALLLLVLRDLADGWLALGFGGTRGRGSIEVSQVVFSGGGLPGAWAGLSGRRLAEIIADPPDGVRQAFTTWREAAQS
jgi:CRISPR/Cas system CSM-associated protein Csm3 (group 7 of RAMP superfamily)